MYDDYICDVLEPEPRTSYLWVDYIQEKDHHVISNTLSVNIR